MKDYETDHMMTQDEMAHERTELAEYRTDMATERTNLAYERTALANSQTLLSFARTAIAVFAAGIGMFEFISSSTIVTIGIVLMVISPFIMAAGIIQYLRVKKRISNNKWE